MKGDAESLVWAFAAVPAALAYCYVLPICSGKRRLLAVLPVVVLFALLPLSFSSVHLRGISAFFLSWLAIFKLLLFSFGRGPLSVAGAASFPTFLAVAVLPIKIRWKPPPPPRLPAVRGSPPSLITRLAGFAVKGLLLALIISSYPRRSRFHRGFVLVLYFAHMYLALDLVLAATAAAGKALIPAGTELEPQFAAPYLSTSLQDFWGRRWNLMVTDILRDAVYAPVRAVCGTAAGVLAVFLTSGLMHEAMFYFLTLEPPTGEVGSFFVLHGACVAIEIAAKKWGVSRGLKPLPPAAAAPLTIAFLLATGMCLFLPQITRSSAEQMVIAESEAVVALLWGLAGRR